jgi:hypothetical protein
VHRVGTFAQENLSHELEIFDSNYYLITIVMSLKSCSFSLAKHILRHYATIAAIDATPQYVYLPPSYPFISSTLGKLEQRRSWPDISRNGSNCRPSVGGSGGGFCYHCGAVCSSGVPAPQGASSRSLAMAGLRELAAASHESSSTQIFAATGYQVWRAHVPPIRLVNADSCR